VPVLGGSDRAGQYLAVAAAQYLLGRGEAVHVRHPDIHQHDSRLQSAHQVDSLQAVRSLAGHANVCLTSQDDAEAGPDQPLVIADDDRDRAAAGTARPPATRARPGTNQLTQLAAAAQVPDDILDAFCVTARTWDEAIEVAGRRYQGVAEQTPTCRRLSASPARPQ
jgi:hypothetical protein